MTCFYRRRLHYTGTTYSDNYKTGFVDANCNIHCLANLFIASTFCFATSRAVNATLTVTALAIRLADHLKQMIKGR
jgi:choline dehydrogenase-like flavoprotein